MPFKVGITRDLLNAAGEPCFDRRAFDVLKTNRDIAWEWVAEDMTELTPEEVLDDAMMAKTELTERLGVEIAGYCYPFSAANRTVVAQIRRAGYRFAVRGLRGERPGSADPFQLPRIEVLGSDGIEEYIAKLPQPKPSGEKQRSAYAELSARRDRATYMDR